MQAAPQMSRRGFLAGTAATACLAALSGAGPARADGSAGQSQAAGAAPAYSFETAPDPIADDQISRTLEADVVIVGAGTAGLVCGVSAAQNGKSVIVIGKDDAPSGQGGSHFAFNSSLCRELGVEVDPAEAVTHELQIMGYRVSEAQWSIFASRSGEAMDWYVGLMEEGGLQATIEVPAYNCGGWTEEYAGSHVFYGGPNDSAFGDLPDELDILVKNLTEELGQTLMLQTRARQLAREGGGRVSAVIAEDADGNTIKLVGKDAVVLATGDYASDDEMMARYCTYARGLSPMKYPATNTGDGHKMALWAGAAMQKNDQHAAMVFGCMDIYRALIVNEDGQRVGNERVSNAFDAMQQLQQPGKHDFSVWDSAYAGKVKVTATRHTTEPDTPEQIQAGFDADVEAGSVKRADTIEELAGLAGIDPDALAATVERYNKLCDAGEDKDFFKSAEFMIPVREAPFYIRENLPSILIACGGLDVTPQMQVLDTAGKPIAGLYALGATAGNFFANTYSTYLAGANLGRNVCFGYLLGRRLAGVED